MKSLDEERNDGLALLQVGLVLAVGTVLLQSPVGHLQEAHQGEAPAHGDGGTVAVEDPAQDLEEVVGAGAQGEEATAGGLAGGVTLLGAHQGQLHVDGKVEQLGDGPAGNGDLLVAVGRGGVLRVAQEVPNQGSEAPVVHGVLEEVAQGHRGAAELVDEEGLELTLDEVEDEEASPELLGLRQRGTGSGGTVDEAGPGGVQHHQGDGTTVLNDEDGTVADLGTQVLVGQHSGSGDAHLGEQGVILARDGDGLVLTSDGHLEGLLVDGDLGAEVLLQLAKGVGLHDGLLLSPGLS
eukprot:206987_1